MNETYRWVTTNNYRVLELILMVRELMPVKKESNNGHDFIELLGIEQDALKENEELFDKYEEETLRIQA